MPYILLGTSLLCLALFRLFPQTMDAIYSCGVYRLFSQGMSTVMSILPFSVAEVTLVLSVILLIYWLVRKRFVLVWRTCLYVISVFLFTCGLNYYRLPLASHLDYPVEKSTAEEFQAMACDLLNQLNQSSASVRRTIDGKFNPDFTFSSMRKEVLLAYDSLSMELVPAVKGYYPSIKPVMASKVMSYSFIMGFFFPWSLEANINKDVPEFWIPALMVHEQAHVRGFMRENEANFMVYLLTRHTKNAELRYSCLLHTFSSVLSAAFKADRVFHHSLLQMLSPVALFDYQQSSRYWEGFQSRWAKVSDTINDAYLKANGQKAGVQSYGQVVDLLIADFKKMGPMMQQNQLPFVY